MARFWLRVNNRIDRVYGEERHPTHTSSGARPVSHSTTLANQALKLHVRESLSLSDTGSLAGSGAASAGY